MEIIVKNIKKTRTVRCKMCGKAMTIPEEEAGPTFCYKCEHKHEIGLGRE